MFFKYSILFLCTEIFNIHKHTLAAHPLPQCAALATVLQRQPPHTPRAHAGEHLSGMHIHVSGMHIHAILTVKNFDNANLRNRKRNLPETVSPAPEKPFPQQEELSRATSVTVSRRRKGSFVSPYSLIRAAEKHVPRSRKGFPASPDGLFRDGIKACLRCGKAHTSDCQPLTQSAQNPRICALPHSLEQIRSSRRVTVNKYALCRRAKRIFMQNVFQREHRA